MRRVTALTNQVRRRAARAAPPAPYFLKVYGLQSGPAARELGLAADF